MGERRGYFKVVQLYYNMTPILEGTTAESTAIHLCVSDHLSMLTANQLWTAYATGCAYTTPPH